MNKISNYEELRIERRRLESLVDNQQLYIKTSLDGILDKFKPITKVVSFMTGIGKKTDSKAGSLLKLGSSIGIDLLIGQKLKKAGWLARVLVPLALKLTARKTVDKVQK